MKKSIIAAAGIAAIIATTAATPALADAVINQAQQGETVNGVEVVERSDRQALLADGSILNNDGGKWYTDQGVEVTIDEPVQEPTPHLDNNVDSQDKASHLDGTHSEPATPHLDNNVDSQDKASHLDGTHSEPVTPHLDNNVDSQDKASHLDNNVDSQDKASHLDGTHEEPVTPHLDGTHEEPVTPHLDGTHSEPVTPHLDNNVDSQDKASHLDGEHHETEPLQTIALPKPAEEPKEPHAATKPKEEGKVIEQTNQSTTRPVQDSKGTASVVSSGSGDKSAKKEIDVKATAKAHQAKVEHSTPTNKAEDKNPDGTTKGDEQAGSGTIATLPKTGENSTISNILKLVGAGCVTVAAALYAIMIANNRKGGHR